MTGAEEVDHSVGLDAFNQRIDRVGECSLLTVDQRLQNAQRLGKKALCGAEITRRLVMAAHMASLQ